MKSLTSCGAKRHFECRRALGRNPPSAQSGSGGRDETGGVRHAGARWIPPGCGSRGRPVAGAGSSTGVPITILICVVERADASREFRHTMARASDDGRSRTPRPCESGSRRARPGALRPARTGVVGSGTARCCRAVGEPTSTRSPTGRKSWGPSTVPSTATPRRRNRPAIHNVRPCIPCPTQVRSNSVESQ
jgi:hypothetical protein